MSHLKETKRRILSVKNTQKITKAMQLVSASKFARVVQQKEQAQKYHSYLSRMLAEGLQQVDEKVMEPYLVPGSSPEGESSKGLVVVLTSDRGLCGALNAQVLKKANEALKDLSEKSQPAKVLLWGKKSWGLARHLQGMGHELIAREPQMILGEAYGECRKVAGEFFSAFAAGTYPWVQLVHACFESVLVQRVRVEGFLPFSVDLQELSSQEGEEDKSSFPKVLWEPDFSVLVPRLMKQALVTELYRVMLEVQACEQAARMTAMDHATQNAGEVIKNLTLEYNRVRQAAITTELVEITSGAEALSH